jgi:hypothetical protein
VVGSQQRAKIDAGAQRPEDARERAARIEGRDALHRMSQTVFEV